MATVLIKNGRIVTAVDDYQADLLIEDGRIQTIGQGLVVGARDAYPRDGQSRSYVAAFAGLALKVLILRCPFCLS